MVKHALGCVKGMFQSQQFYFTYNGPLGFSKLLFLNLALGLTLK
jgi:hypothetical protein